jgi:hypothetical protein
MDTDIPKRIKEILVEQNPHEKERQLEQLSDVFEYCHDLSKRDVAEAVQLLLAEALQEEDQRTLESFFHTINNAVVYQHIGSCIDWNTLAVSLSSLGKEELEYALDILGFSGKVRYLPVLKEYTQHTDPEIREWAQEAIDELKYRLARVTDSRKAG